MRLLSQRFLSELLLRIIFWILTLVIPKKKDLIVFSQSQYFDNSKFLFEWMIINSPHQIYWLLHKDCRIPLEISVSAKNFVPLYSLRGLWMTLRARVVVISYSLADFGYFKHIIKHAIVVHLWHGITIKCVGLLNRRFNTRKKEKFLRRETNYFDMIIASSDIDRYMTASYQGLSIDQVHVTGLPRNDYLITNRLNYTLQAERESGVRNVLYAPTFRDYREGHCSLFFPFIDYDEISLVKFLRVNKIHLFLRPHRLDRFSTEHTHTLANKYEDVIKSLTADVLPDVNEKLPTIDIVISDYSSIYADLLLNDIPCIFIPFDIEKYQRLRGIAYDYDSITPGPKVNTQADLLAALSAALTGMPAWKQHREIVRKIFHKNTDGGSCKRISLLIDDVIYEN